jgi:hypothetical protein
MVTIGPEDGSNKQQYFSSFYSVNLCHIKMHLYNYFYTQGFFFQPAAYRQTIDVYQKIVLRFSSQSIKMFGKREKHLVMYFPLGIARFW